MDVFCSLDGIVGEPNDLSRGFEVCVVDLVVGPILACCAHTAEGTGGGTVSHVLSCAGRVRAWSCPLGHPHTSIWGVGTAK